jgi:Reverse transcriptase (RNA-dependent DNA polymerase)
LMQFIHDVGVPNTLISDNAPEEIYGRARDTCTKYRINVKTIVPHSPWQNLAEASIREIKKAVRRTLRRTGTPLRLWPQCTEYCTAVRRLTASTIPQLRGRTPTEYVEGSTPDISAYAMFDWYQPVFYLTPVIDYPHERKCIGRWLGVAEECTDEMAFTILAGKGKVIVRKSVWAISDDEMAQPSIKEKLAKFDESIKLAYDHNWPVSSDVDGSDILNSSEDKTESPAAAEDSSLELHNYTHEEMDEYLHKELELPRGGELAKARVLKRSRDGDGIPTGYRHENSILDTRQYEVEFQDGSIDTYTANVIAENLAAMVDPEGRQHSLFSGIIDHRYDDKDREVDYTDKTGTIQPRMTTQGWELLVQWTDGTTSWHPLVDLKNSNPVEVAEYAISRSIDNEPAFRWWVRQALRKRDRFVCKVKTRYWKRTHKYGIEMPKSVKQALAIDARTGTSFWREAIAKEMKNVKPAFSFRDDDRVPNGYKKIDCHMVFDIKVDLTRKARLVAGGHQTEVPKESVYSSVVSRDSVRIALTIASLNGLDVLAADVQNAYLNAPTKEKCYTIAGPEFGPDNEGRPVLIVRALYGLRSSGARWRDHLAETIRKMGFVACLADGDVWLRPNAKPGGDSYYEYVLVYVDDILAISHDPQAIMDNLSKHYTLKPGSVRAPKEYLGSDISRYNVVNGPDDTSVLQCWSMSARTYIKRAVTEVKRVLAEVNQRLKTKVTTPMSDKYRAELDSTPELDAERITYYQGLIGVLRWIVELGRIDIMVAVAMLSSHLMAPRQGHLEQCFHIFAYLDSHENSTLVFDPSYRSINEARFVKNDWSQYYPDAAEAIPHNIPRPRGKDVVVSCYCDADHAGCRVTRRSHSGILIFVNNAPVTWYSKRQNTVESSTFGSEFIAMRVAVEQVEGLRYKLRMMGIPIDGPANLFCDNQSVFKNCSYPESTLKKKHNAIAYHRTREAQASNTIRVAWESGETNLSDILTKLLPGPRLRELSRQLLH